MFNSRRQPLSPYCLALAVYASVFACAGCLILKDTIDVQITSGGVFANIVNLPGGSRPPDEFVAKGNHFSFGLESRIEFRTVRDNENELLLRVFEKDYDTYYYADTAFALDGSQKLRARRATNEEWKSGREVRLADRIEEFAPMRDRSAVDDGRAFTFQGKRFEHNAKGSVFLLSPGRRRVAIFGLDRELRQGTFDLQPFTYLLKLYDVPSGKMLASAQGYVKSHDLSIGQEMYWVTDRYFYIPLRMQHDKLLFFDFGSDKRRLEKK